MQVYADQVMIRCRQHSESPYLYIVYSYHPYTRYNDCELVLQATRFDLTPSSG